MPTQKCVWDRPAEMVSDSNVAELGKPESLITFVADRPGHDRRYAIDSQKIESELGFQPQHNLASGLHDTVQWYLDNPTWIERVTSGVYRGQRLGLGRNEDAEE